MDGIEKAIQEAMAAQNNRKVPDFEGYSPAEMHYLLHDSFHKESPLTLKSAKPQHFMKVPIFNLVGHLMEHLENQGGIKLTQKGHLPVRLVADLYAQGFYEEEDITSGITKLYKEEDAMSITLARLLPELAGWTKKRKGRLSLTSRGKRALHDDRERFETLFKVFGTAFNWAYFDRYESEEIGQFGLGFSLLLLCKYGNEKRSTTFYAEKYFKAFPQLLQDLQEPWFTDLHSQVASCYALRLFSRFLSYFGVISLEKEGKGFNAPLFVKKTPLFDTFFHLSPHRSL
ncbi:hypothetical protein [Maribacter sp. 2307ULW6-5]|uniref:hypothetical protein n=1 Tax=Maribacter sp. 2307ULW6-5 TaxID=3386275 RepID=UPI0039BD4D26